MKKDEQEKRKQAAPLRGTQENVESFYGQLGISKIVKEQGDFDLFKDFYDYRVDVMTNSRA